MIKLKSFLKDLKSAICLLIWAFLLNVASSALILNCPIYLKLSVLVVFIAYTAIGVKIINKQITKDEANKTLDT